MVEALGGWHEDAAPVVSKLARQLASHASNDALSEAQSPSNERKFTSNPEQNTFPFHIFRMLVHHVFYPLSN